MPSWIPWLVFLDIVVVDHRQEPLAFVSILPNDIYFIVIILLFVTHLLIRLYFLSSALWICLPPCGILEISYPCAHSGISISRLLLSPFLRYYPSWCCCHWVAIVPVFISIILNDCCHFIINRSCRWHGCCALILAHIRHFSIGNMLSLVIVVGDGHYLHNVSNHSYDKYRHIAPFKGCCGGWQ